MSSALNQPQSDIKSIKVIEKVEIHKIEKTEIIVVSKNPSPMSEQQPSSEKSRDAVKADRQAKKISKQLAKQKQPPTEDKVKLLEPAGNVKLSESDLSKEMSELKIQKTREEIIAERTMKKLAKQHGKHKTEDVVDNKCAVKESDPAQFQGEGKKTLTKAERRAIQESQRAAKAALSAKGPPAKVAAHVEEKKSTPPKPEERVKISPKCISNVKHAKTTNQRTVKLFSHLYEDKIILDTIHNQPNIHPAVKKLGIQYATRVVAGSNARCIAFLNAMKHVIADYETSSQKEFSRGLEAHIHPCVNFLRKCRPISVSMDNAWKAIIRQLTHTAQLSACKNQETKSLKEEKLLLNDLKHNLIESIDTYISEQIEKAAQAISITVQQKISDGDVILTFGCSSLIQHILLEAHRRDVNFRVIVVDARPLHEGQEMLRRLVAQGIKCVCVLINAIGFIMPEVTKVLLGAHALLANGYVTSRAGTAQIALVAKSFNVPVLVCCETHKFSCSVQTDAFVYNEIGDPDDLIIKSTAAADPLSNWSTIPNLTPLNLYYDVTPPELVTAVVTEIAILPCTSVPVILRIKPSEINP